MRTQTGAPNTSIRSSMAAPIQSRTLTDTGSSMRPVLGARWTRPCRWRRQCQRATQWPELELLAVAVPVCEGVPVSLEEGVPVPLPLALGVALGVSTGMGELQGGEGGRLWLGEGVWVGMGVLMGVGSALTGARGRPIQTEETGAAAKSASSEPHGSGSVAASAACSCDAPSSSWPAESTTAAPRCRI